MAIRLGVGIDVSKASVDVASTDGELSGNYAQSSEGLGSLAVAIARLSPHRVVVEASGGYEQALLAVLHAHDVPVVLVQPGRARSFARALGRLAKTDAIDAAVLATMASMAVDATPLWKPLDENVAKLRSLVHRRLQLLKHIDAETKRRRRATGVARESIDRMLGYLRQEKQLVEKAVAVQVREVDSLKELVDALDETKGVGLVTAASIVVEIPELGNLSRGEVASLAGLAPMNNDSGTKTGRRSIQGGRARARKALYMATLTAIKHNHHIRDVYARLCERGKPAKVAIIACMRKLLIHLNAVARQVLLAGAAAPT